MKRSVWILLFLICATVVMPDGAMAIDFSWSWAPNGSTYTSGPDGDIVYDLYMRDDDDADYAYDYPLMAGIEDCTGDDDLYSCRASLDYDFMPGVNYYFVVVAYLSEDPALRSASSNEVHYYIDPANEEPVIEEPGLQDSGAGGGGGCFVDSNIIEFFSGCDTNK